MADVATREFVQVVGKPWLASSPPATRFIFRGDAAARAAAGSVLGLRFPDEACRAVVNAFRAVLWLGPDEYLLLAPEADGALIEGEISQALAGQPHSLVDVSHRQVGLSLTGPHAEWLLEAQCPLPLNLRDFPVGMCTRTVFSKAEIVLWRQSPQDFHIEAWRSFSAYVAELLQEIATELPA